MKCDPMSQMPVTAVYLTVFQAYSHNSSRAHSICVQLQLIDSTGDGPEKI